MTPDSVARPIDDYRIRNFRGTLLIAWADQTIELSDVAAFIWRRLDGLRPVESIARDVSEAYDVDLTEAMTDTIELLAELRTIGLITVSAGTSRSA